MMEKQHYREVGEHNIAQWIGTVLLIIVKVYLGVIAPSSVIDHGQKKALIACTRA